MAARAHWFEDEEPRPGRTRLRKPPNETPEKPGTVTRLAESRRRAQVHPVAATHAARDDLIRLALGPDGEVAPDVRARAPGRGAWIGVDRADARGGAGQGQAEGRAGPRVQDRRRSPSPPISASGSRRRLRQAVLDRLGLEARVGNLADRLRADRGRGAPGRGPPAAPRRRRRRGRQPQARPGLAGRRRAGGKRRARLGFPGGQDHIVIGARAAKMWYMSP